MFEKIKKWYTMGLWSKPMVRNAVSKGVLAAEEAEKIFGRDPM